MKMFEDPFVHADIMWSNSVALLFKQAKSCNNLSATSKLKLDNVQDKYPIKFTLLKELHEDLIKVGVKGLQPLWSIVDKSGVSLPPPNIPPRDIVVQQRIESLTAKFANMEYKKMTKNMTPLHTTKIFSSSGIREFRCMNKQILMILNFTLIVAGSFVFGYFLSDIFGQSQASPSQRIVCGFSIAVIVFFADLYFLIKNVDTCDEQSHNVKTT